VQVDLTLSLLQQATVGLDLSKNWRATMYLKRGFYDAFVRARYVFEGAMRKSLRCV
jgi:hypothetical protein